MTPATPAAGHTAGTPWTTENSYVFMHPHIVDSTGRRIVELVHEDDALRIIASVNALAELTVCGIEQLSPADILAAMQHKVAGDRVERLEAACRVALATIDALVGQQAMPDDWWVAEANKISAALSPAPAPSEEEQV